MTLDLSQINITLDKINHKYWSGKIKATKELSALAVGSFDEKAALVNILLEFLPTLASRSQKVKQDTLKTITENLFAEKDISFLVFLKDHNNLIINDCATKALIHLKRDKNLKVLIDAANILREKIIALPKLSLEEKLDAIKFLNGLVHQSDRHRDLFAHLKIINAIADLLKETNLSIRTLSMVILYQLSKTKKILAIMHESHAMIIIICLLTETAPEIIIPASYIVRSASDDSELHYLITNDKAIKSLVGLLSNSNHTVQKCAISTLSVLVNKFNVDNEFKRDFSNIKPVTNLLMSDDSNIRASSIKVFEVFCDNLTADEKLSFFHNGVIISIVNLLSDPFTKQKALSIISTCSFEPIHIKELLKFLDSAEALNKFVDNLASFFADIPPVTNSYQERCITTSILLLQKIAIQSIAAKTLIIDAGIKLTLEKASRHNYKHVRIAVNLVFKPKIFNQQVNQAKRLLSTTSSKSIEIKKTKIFKKKPAASGNDPISSLFFSSDFEGDYSEAESSTAETVIDTGFEPVSLMPT